MEIPRSADICKQSSLEDAQVIFAKRTAKESPKVMWSSDVKMPYHHSKQKYLPRTRNKDSKDEVFTPTIQNTMGLSIITLKSST